jgi:hypothetical protein
MCIPAFEGLPGAGEVIIAGKSTLFSSTEFASLMPKSGE